jgi:DNA-binding CsgD family transcriptional regulator
MTTSPVLLLDSTEKPAPSKESDGDCPRLAGALFLLSRKLLALQAIVNINGWRGSAAHDEGAANHLLNLCVSRIIEISQLPNTFPEITQKVLDAYKTLYLVESHHSTIHEHGPNGLTRREVEIVRHLAEGKCNKEIAATLRVSVKTVETYRTRIMLKLGAHSLSDVTRFAVRHGIITILLDQPS